MRKEDIKMNVSEIRARVLILIIAYFVVGHTFAWAESFEPQRENGVSAYLVPENIVKKVNKRYIQRFIVKSKDGKSVMAYDATAEGLIKQIKNQSLEIQKNGLWLVITNPSAYSPDDLKELEKLNMLTKNANIPYFVCRGIELPNGWKKKNGSE